MILVEKRLIKKPASLVGSKSAAATELTKAKAHYNQKKPGTSAYPFAVYKAPDVVKALNTLFHNKCAYCETDYSATQPMAVEHYRPKGGVTGAPKHPGYWWLAADWDNLLPSCNDCNSHRGKLHYVLTSDRQVHLETIERLSGKQNHFPIACESARCTRPSHHVIREQPLLLNPCKDDPTRHLKWIFTQLNFPFLIPLDERAETTISLCGLNRKRLLEKRKKKLDDISLRVTSIRRLAYSIAKLKPTERHVLEAHFIDEIASLKAYEGSQEEWSAMSRAYINLHLATLETEFKTLFSEELIL
ncbi:hypothetical protein OGV39_22830 [Citrobacter sp. Cb022]|uniref:hypothetical protein n=1 Tax=Citrobacter sp. Cb022 TaxID=2985019 RepID=UPI00257E560D|nr:hypothetical protein [Citrobacter sp. Cb022]ELK7436476.1 hypothetical protein [Citrobacter braakii]MDM3409720.1 hypothetical protein [Citrobacter sp. Cb022]